MLREQQMSRRQEIEESQYAEYGDEEQSKEEQHKLQEIEKVLYVD